MSSAGRTGRLKGDTSEGPAEAIEHWQYVMDVDGTVIGEELTHRETWLNGMLVTDPELARALLLELGGND